MAIQATALRQSKLYYDLYCLLANTLFAYLAPLLSLIYLNICTVLGQRKNNGIDHVSDWPYITGPCLSALRKMGKSIAIFEAASGPPRRQANDHTCNSLVETSGPKLPCAMVRISDHSSHTHQDDDADSLSQSHHHQEPVDKMDMIVAVVPKSASTARMLLRQRLRSLLMLRSRSDDPIQTQIARQRKHQANTVNMFLSIEDGQRHNDEDGDKITHQNHEDSQESGSLVIASDQAHSPRNPRKCSMTPRKRSAMLASGLRPRQPKIRISRSPSETALQRNGSSGSLMRRQENRLTRISLSIVSLFVACHVWRLIPTVYEAFFSEDTVLEDWPRWLVHVNHLSHTLIVFNSSVNFLLYVVW